MMLDLFVRLGGSLTFTKRNVGFSRSFCLRPFPLHYYLDINIVITATTTFIITIPSRELENNKSKSYTQRERVGDKRNTSKIPFFW